MSLIPKAIELAFELQSGRITPSGRPQVEHCLRVWERFRHHRPLADTPVARYEELACVALLHDAVHDGLIAEAELARQFGYFVADAVGRAGAGQTPSALQDPDVQLIVLLGGVDDLVEQAATLPPDEVERRVVAFERDWLAPLGARSPELLRELRFQLDDLRRELPNSIT